MDDIDIFNSKRGLSNERDHDLNINGSTAPYMIKAGLLSFLWWMN